jgi:hypothetical protein
MARRGGYELKADIRIPEKAAENVTSDNCAEEWRCCMCRFNFTSRSIAFTVHVLKCTKVTDMVRGGNDKRRPKSSKSGEWISAGGVVVGAWYMQELRTI